MPRMLSQQRQVVLPAVAAGRDVSSRAASLEDVRAGLAERFRARQPEIEAAVLALVERMIAQVAAEYDRELEGAERSPERRRAERVQRLLDGVPVDVGEFDYELDAWHVGVIATGANAEKAVRGLAAALGRELFLLKRAGEVWAWLGGQHKLMIVDVERALSVQGLADVSLVIGEVARGVEGWRLTHREAQAALLVARHRPRRLTRYQDVALEAAALQDEAIAQSLIETYLSPLDDGHGGGAMRRRMLRAFFEAEHNVSSAAAGLKVDRSTVRRWRGEIEQRLGCRLHERRAEIEVALRLEELCAHGGTERAPAERSG
jgi:GGDEF-like domain